MKKALPVMMATIFIVGIALIITSDSGLIANYYSANIAGALLSCFSGIYLGICLYFHYKSKQ